MSLELSLYSDDGRISFRAPTLSTECFPYEPQGTHELLGIPGYTIYGKSGDPKATIVFDADGRQETIWRHPWGLDRDHEARMKYITENRVHWPVYTKGYLGIPFEAYITDPEREREYIIWRADLATIRQLIELFRETGRPDPLVIPHRFIASATITNSQKFEVETWDPHNQILKTFTVDLVTGQVITPQP